MTARAGRELGLDVVCHPLSAIEPTPWALPPGKFDGLLLGSANALRHAGPAVEKLVDIPVYAVGNSTASAAAEHRLRVAAVGSGGLQALLETLDGQRLRLLRLAGEERVVLSPPPGIEIVEAIAYRSVERPMSPDLAEMLQGGAVVLLHAAGAARHFANECDRIGIPRDRISLAALGPRIAAAAGEGWREVRSAPQPNDPALLALAREMCHEPFVG